jgi:precorrin-4/cobalt-precorrin-4 C11-methyltransferase
VVVVAKEEQPDQLVLRGTLADLAARGEEAGLRPAAVILVGHALAARDTDDFVESHLYGTRVARLTRNTSGA